MINIDLSSFNLGLLTGLIIFVLIDLIKIN